HVLFTTSAARRTMPHCIYAAGTSKKGYDKREEQCHVKRLLLPARRSLRDSRQRGLSDVPVVQPREPRPAASAPADPADARRPNLVTLRQAGTATTWAASRRTPSRTSSGDT